MLNDPFYIKFFENKIFRDSEIIKVYKIYMILLNKEEIYLINDETLFFKEMSEFLLNNSQGKLGIKTYFITAKK